MWNLEKRFEKWKRFLTESTRQKVRSAGRDKHIWTSELSKWKKQSKMKKTE